MKVNINIGLSDLPNLTKALKGMLSDIEKLEKEAPKEVAEVGKNYLDRQYQNRVKDNNITDYSTETRKKEKDYLIVAKGKDVIYEEFGTGDVGEKNPHPEKSKYDLNDYNSGPFIMDVGDNSNPALKELLSQNGITSGKYWMYRKGGEKHFTQGIRAGKEMYNTAQYLKSNKGIAKIMDKKESDIIDKFIKTVKG